MPPLPPAPPPPVSAPAQIRSVSLTVRQPHRKQTLAIVGERVSIEGRVTPYAAGQRVLVKVARDGRGVLTRSVPIARGAGEEGRFMLTYASPKPGRLLVSAEHVATAQLQAFQAPSEQARFVGAKLRVGSRGPAVWALQYGLAKAHYAVPTSGYYDEATARAVIAFRKVAGLERIDTTSPRIFKLLQRGGGYFRVRYRHEGAHVEGDLTRQVLVEVERHGRVRRIYTMSSGKPSTPTVVGSFRVYSKTPGMNAKGMVDSNYFIRGYAIHGYAEVPAYAASHGCLRIPVPDAAAVYGWVKIGYPVEVYYESGGGSRHVRRNPGP